MSGGGGDGDDVADVTLRGVQGVFEGRHPAHRTADHDGDLFDAERVEDEFV
jgi:hypothetical protein